MPKYTKIFETHAAYNTYITGNNKELPNLSYCENNHVHFNNSQNIIAKFNVVTNQSGAPTLYIDDFPQDYADDEYDGDMEAFKQDFVDHVDNIDHINDDSYYMNQYIYTGETFEYNNNEYYLWELNGEVTSSNVKYILTDTLYFMGLSLEDNLDNDYCPFVYILNEDLEVEYTNQQKSSYVLVAYRGISSLKLYIDDFPQDFADGEYDGDMEAFKQDWVNDVDDNTYGMNVYTYKNETFEYNNNEYYLWELDGNVGDVKYMLTDTLDFTGLSLEDDIDNDYCPFTYILDNDSNVIYTNSEKSSYVLVAVRGGISNGINEKVLYNTSNISKIKINGVEQSQVKSQYTFDTPGEQTIKYTLIDKGSLDDEMFLECYDLISIKLPNTITSIGIDTFYRCTSLTSINIPNSVTTIGAQAFLDCTGLTSITIPNSVTTIGHRLYRSYKHYNT